MSFTLQLSMESYAWIAWKNTKIRNTSTECRDHSRKYAVLLI